MCGAWESLCHIVAFVQVAVLELVLVDVTFWNYTMFWWETPLFEEHFHIHVYSSFHTEWALFRRVSLPPKRGVFFMLGLKSRGDSRQGEGLDFPRCDVFLVSKSCDNFWVRSHVTLVYCCCGDRWYS